MKRILDPEEDYLNQKRTRNSQNTDSFDYNCAGYCLNTYCWYNPYDDLIRQENCDDMMELVELLFNFYGHKVEEIYEELLDCARDKILKDFDGDIRVIQSFKQIKRNEKLVIYKIGIDYEFDMAFNIYEVNNCDFHFKQLDKLINNDEGYWSHKPGGTEIIKTCQSIEDIVKNPWVREDNWAYDSDCILFAVKK